MASVRKRAWVTRRGEQRETWLVDYTDTSGKRRYKAFERKKDADAWASTTAVAVREGMHVADRASVTVAEAGKLWLATAKQAKLERTTIEQYEQHLKLHIVGDGAPEGERRVFIGHLKLSQLNAPTVRAFEDRLHDAGRSPAMVKYVVRSLGALLADAQERGLIIRNPVRELKRGRGKKKQDRHLARPEVGVDIPTPEEIQSIIHAAEGHWRPLLLTAIFTGLRASELRGLRWEDVDLDPKGSKINVRQRADRFNKIGPPKSKAGRRTVPLPRGTAQALREWKPICPRKDGKQWLVFPNGEGNVEWHTNLVLRGLQPTLINAGVTKPVLDAKGRPTRDDDGKPVVEAKYGGMHALRHFYASWCASIGLSMKAVQSRMGHSNIAVTMDTYTHLFPDTNDDADKLAKAERALMSSH